MVKRHNQHDPQKKRGTQLTLWIAIGGLIGLFLGFFIGILFGGMIFMPILAILGAAIGGTTGGAMIQQKSVPRGPHDNE